jgi:hypothetical protein
VATTLASPIVSVEHLLLESFIGIQSGLYTGLSGAVCFMKPASPDMLEKFFSLARQKPEREGVSEAGESGGGQHCLRLPL